MIQNFGNNGDVDRITLNLKGKTVESGNMRDRTWQKLFA